MSVSSVKSGARAAPPVAAAVAGGGATDSFIILADVPADLELGIDSITYQTGPKFKGLSCVPAGLHFLYHGSGMSDRQGFFLQVKQKEVIVKCWDPSNEELSPQSSLSPEATVTLVQELSAGVLNGNLGPYPMHQHSTWMNMSTFISDTVLEKADCSPGTLIFPGDESDLTSGRAATYKQLAREQLHGSSKPNAQALKPYYPGCARVAVFTPLKAAELDVIRLLSNPPSDSQQVNSKNGVLGAAVTALMMDKSTVLRHLIDNYFGGREMDLLGELQLAFLLFMLIFSAPALQQWKELVHLICTSEDFLQQNEKFSAAFIRCFYSQLSFAPSDFFDNELSVDNFLRPTITALFSSLSPPIKITASTAQLSATGASKRTHAHSEYTETLFEHKKRLRKFLQKKFNLQETMPFSSVDENGVSIMYEEEDFYNLNAEDMPTVVSAAEVADILCTNGEASQLSARYTSASSSSAEQRSSDTEDLLGGMRIARSATHATTTAATATTVAEEEGESEQAATEVSSYASRLLALDSALQSSADALGKSSIVSDATRVASLLPVSSSEAAAEAEGSEPMEEQKTALSINDQYSRVALSSVPLDSASERESALFSWRYPLVYESMLLSQGKEDMTMAAMRIIEEYQQLCRHESTTNTSSASSIHPRKIENTAAVPTAMLAIEQESVVGMEVEGTVGSSGGDGSLNRTQFTEIMRMRHIEASQFVEYEIGHYSRQ